LPHVLLPSQGNSENCDGMWGLEDVGKTTKLYKLYQGDVARSYCILLQLVSVQNMGKGTR